MKLALFLLSVMAFAITTTTTAFVVVHRPSDAVSSVRSTTTALHANNSRRDVVRSAALLLGYCSLSVITPGARAELDYSKIQDLLGTSDQNAVYYAPQQQQPGKRPSWLTEPTEEFKENESKAAEFKRKNLQMKQKFASTLDVVTTAPNSETTLVETLDELRRMVKANGGLPIGITKEEIVKTCRRRKSKKYWPTSVEIAYQDLLYEIGYQQSPNTDRDTSKL
jgi:hypothetical protein